VPIIQSKSHIDGPGMQPGPLSEKPATIQNSHGTARRNIKVWNEQWGVRGRKI